MFPHFIIIKKYVYQHYFRAAKYERVFEFILGFISLKSCIYILFPFEKQGNVSNTKLCS